MVSKLPKTGIELSADETANATLICGRSRFEVRGLDGEQFPHEFMSQLTPGPDAQSITVRHLTEAIELVGFASDKRELSSILNGICVERGDRGLEVAATDGSRLAYWRVPGLGTSQPHKAVIPTRTMQELSRMLAGVDGDGDVKCFFPESSRIAFAAEGRAMSSSLIEGAYPQYQSLIPSVFEHTARLNKEALRASLERVAVLASERTRVVKLLFEGMGVLTVSANTPDFGGAEDKLDMDSYEGEDFSIAFNVNYMLECLRALGDRCHQVELKMSEPLKPLILQPAFQEEPEWTYLYLLMPVQMR
jgi:DNA polymerase-3 subunit beta